VQGIETSETNSSSPLKNTYSACGDRGINLILYMKYFLMAHFGTQGKAGRQLVIERWALTRTLGNPVLCKA
jgi:hypothetical protein